MIYFDTESLFTFFSESFIIYLYFFNILRRVSYGTANTSSYYVAAYLIGMLLVGFIVGKLKIKDSSDYMLAGRRMGLFMVAFSLSANNIGGGSTTGLAQKPTANGE